MACIDLRSLSPKRPSMYWVAASRCGCRLKHALNPSRNRPNRRSSARAGPVVTRAAYRTYGKSTSPWVPPPSRAANQPDNVVLTALVRRTAGEILHQLPDDALRVPEQHVGVIGGVELVV